MQVIFKKILLIAIALFLTNAVLSQCNNFVAQYPSGTQTTNSSVLSVISTCMYGREYAVCSVVSGESYVWTTCGDTDFDSQITIWNTAHTISYGYNDDECGLQSTATCTMRWRQLL